MKGLAILGCTGSIGVTTLDLVARFPDRFRVVALAGGKNVERLAQQVSQFRPAVVRQVRQLTGPMRISTFAPTRRSKFRLI